MRIRLNVKDRIILAGILPQQGSFLKMRIVAEMREELLFSVKEQKELNIQDAGNGNLSWDTSKDPMKEFKWYDDKQVHVAAEVLKALDKDEKLGTDHVRLYEIFVMEDKSPVSMELKVSGISTVVSAVEATPHTKEN